MKYQLPKDAPANKHLLEKVLNLTLTQVQNRTVARAHVIIYWIF